MTDQRNMTPQEAEAEYQKFFEHDYDGIQEYDNPLPGWWTLLFWGSVIFSCFYAFYYHVGTGPSLEDKYQAAVASNVEKLLAQAGDIAPDDATIVRLMDDDKIMSSMAGLFRGNCAQCHANDGGGNVGPNLTDEHYVNVSRPEDIYDIIANGIPGTSMPAWGNRLREPQMILLAAYVASLRGTTPAAPKEAEGSVIPPWPEPEPAEESASEDAQADRTAPAISGTDSTGT